MAPSVVGKPSGEVTVDMGIAGKLPYEAAGRHGDISSLIHPLYSKSEKKGGDLVVRRVFPVGHLPSDKVLPSWETSYVSDNRNGRGGHRQRQISTPRAHTPPPPPSPNFGRNHRPPSRNVRKSTNRGQKNCARTKTATRFQTPHRRTAYVEPIPMF